MARQAQVHCLKQLGKPLRMICQQLTAASVLVSAPDAEVDDSAGLASWPQAAWDTTPDTLLRANYSRGLDSTPGANAVVDSAAGKVS